MRWYFCLELKNKKYETNFKFNRRDCIGGEYAVGVVEGKEADLAAAVNRQLESLQRSRAEVVRTEAEGNWLQRSWRPIVMLAFAGIVLAGVFFDLPLLSEKSRLWDLLEIGIGGYVVGWSLEKVAACWKGGAR